MSNLVNKKSFTLMLGDEIDELQNLFKYWESKEDEVQMAITKFGIQTLEGVIESLEGGVFDDENIMYLIDSRIEHHEGTVQINYNDWLNSKPKAAELKLIKEKIIKGEFDVKE